MQTGLRNNLRMTKRIIWLAQVGCTWSDVTTLRQDMERSLSSSNAHFRIKLLQAVAQLQVSLKKNICKIE